MNRVSNTPCFARREDEVEAELYNLWRRVRMRLPRPLSLRIPLPGRPGVEMIVEDREWVCVDVRRSDLPILAWVDFEGRNRSALHAPVRCWLNYYHFAASRYRAPALEAMKQALERILRNPR